MSGEFSLSQAFAAAGITAYPGSKPRDIEADPGARYPCVTFAQMSGVEVYSHSGDSHLCSALWGIRCWDATYTGAKALAAQVLALLAPLGVEVVGVHDMREPQTDRWQILVSVSAYFAEGE